jgi:predicted peptidase
VTYCYHYSVFVPGQLDPQAKMPVIVWIHGGGYDFEMDTIGYFLTYLPAIFLEIRLVSEGAM